MRLCQVSSIRKIIILQITLSLVVFTVARLGARGLSRPTGIKFLTLLSLIKCARYVVTAVGVLA